METDVSLILNKLTVRFGTHINMRDQMNTIKNNKKYFVVWRYFCFYTSLEVTKYKI